MLGASKPRSRTCPVVLSERVTASFAGFIGGAVSADEVQRGRSPFAERLGEELASSAYVLADDGIDPGGFASAPFDGEGTPRGRTPLIADGKLLAYLHDSYTARRGGERSTGNAARASYRSAPSVSPSNLVLEPGDLTLGDGLPAPIVLCPRPLGVGTQLGHKIDGADHVVVAESRTAIGKQHDA